MTVFEPQELIHHACDADQYSFERANGLPIIRSKVTVLDAHVAAGLIRYRYHLYGFTKENEPMADEFFDTLTEAHDLAHRLNQLGYHGAIYHTVERKYSDGGWEQLNCKNVWTF